MKKIILVIAFIIPSFCIYAQFQVAEQQSLDSLLKSGKLTSNQTDQLYKKYTDSNYPEFKTNNNTGEIEISEMLTFTNLDKKIIFQRCLEWIAINYGNLVHHDLESGKIIAHGLIDLNHFEGYTYGLATRNLQQIQTPTNYTLILTIKDNKMKYLITNVYYNFHNFSETIDEISYPMSKFYPRKTLGQQWIKFFTILNASSDMFYSTLKNSLINYIMDEDKDFFF